VFHERNVLEGGRMKDDLRAMLAEERGEQSTVANAAENWDAPIAIAETRRRKSRRDAAPQFREG
jgi:hypothetical protein